MRTFARDFIFLSPHVWSTDGTHFGWLWICLGFLLFLLLKIKSLFTKYKLRYNKKKWAKLNYYSVRRVDPFACSLFCYVVKHLNAIVAILSLQMQMICWISAFLWAAYIVYIKKGFTTMTRSFFVCVCVIFMPLITFCISLSHTFKYMYSEKYRKTDRLNLIFISIALCINILIFCARLDFFYGEKIHCSPVQFS